VADTHDTDPNPFNERLGLGDATICQEVPFQDSTSVQSPLGSSYCPTAVQEVADGHDTDCRFDHSTPVVPGDVGSGAETICQEVPSHVSING